MVKTIGLLSLFLSIVLMGTATVARMNERVKFLSALKSLMQYLKYELSFRSPELSELYSGNPDKTTKQLTDIIADRINSGESPKNSAESAVNTPTVRRLLSDAESEFLLEIFSQIGSTDLNNTKEMLEDAEKRIEIFENDAREYVKQNSKAKLALTVYVGAAIVILLM